MSTLNNQIQGCTELIILAQLYANDSYAHEIIRDTEQKTDGNINLNPKSLYTVLRRLEQSNCITQYWGNKENNARRKYYKITETGKETYQNLKEDWETAKKWVDSLIYLSPKV